MNDSLSQTSASGRREASTVRGSGFPGAAAGRPVLGPAGGSATGFSLIFGLTGSALALVAGAWLGSPAGLFGRSLEVQALTAGSGGDLDADGLLDVQEEIGGTNAANADTDGDGFEDLVEFSRKSDPTSLLSIPSPGNQLDLGMAAYSDGSIVQLTTGIYLPGNHQGGLSLNFGLYFGGVTVQIPFSSLASLTTIESFAATGQNALVFKLTTLVPDSLLQSLGTSTIFATLGPAGGLPPSAAAAVTLKPIAGVLTSVRQQQQLSPGLIYQPIQPVGSLPLEFEQGKVCYQGVISVGQSGAIELLAIESADCLSAAGTCVPSCNSEIGNTIELIDPLALIGG